MKFFLTAIAALLLLAGMAAAAETRVIELVDGSTITGELLSLSEGVYTVRSAALGTIKINESKVRAIRSKGPAGTAADAGSQVKSLQDAMMSQADIMSMIQALQNDPEFQKVLKDPEIMKAVQAGDIAVLTANPRFMRLLNNHVVQEIKKKLAP
ncbi:MAG: hypothetical protein WA610_07425 [Thermodesulfovibrionales bacterium]